MDIISYCFNHSDFKVMNMESCEIVANELKDPLFISLCDKNLCERSR